MHNIRLRMQEIQQVREMTNADMFFDESYIRHAAAHLYKTDRESQDVRASLHLSMARLVETIWVWSYEMAVVKLKHDGELHHVVPLPHKQLPSRANPSARYHKPPKPKEPPPTPNYDKALKGALALPKPRRRNEAPLNSPTPYLPAED